LTVSVDVNGRRYAVEVTSRDGVVLVSVDGRRREVDVTHAGGVISLLLDGTRSYEATVARSSHDAMTVCVDGVPVELTVTAGPGLKARSSGHGRSEDGPQQGPQQVKAPMPGKIVKVLVKPGDRVEPRQGLIVVEAMKMENELRARAAGTVREVRVTEGASVEAGAILVLLE
jgi:biotin carboxyl carrier protein